MGKLRRDLRFALRQLVRNPGFTAVAVLTLALGIGATTAVFSVVNTVVLRPLPYPEAERYTNLGWGWAGGSPTASITTYKFSYFREHADVFEGLATYQSFTPDVETGRGLHEASGMRVSEDFFRVLGWEMALGRGFLPEEDRPGGPDVAVIGHRLWREAFDGRHDVLGERILVDGAPFSVVGVAHPDVHMAHTTTVPEVFVPRRLVPDPLDQGHNTIAIARVRPGVGPQQLQADLERVTARFRAEHPELIGAEERGLAAIGFQELYVGDTGRNLWIMLAAVGVVLLIGCVNLANLLLARATERRREIATRAALGAGRGAIVRQMVTESLVLAGIGAVAGLLIAAWATGALVGLAPAGIPRIGDVGIDLRVLAFTAAVATATGLLFGLGAAIPATRGTLVAAIREGSGGGTGGRGQGVARSALVVAQVSLTMVLLAGAGLLVATFLLLRGADTGYDLRGTVAVDFQRVPTGFADDPAALWSFQRQALERLRAIPGVEHAASASNVPTQTGWNIPITIAGRPDASQPDAQWRAVSPGYLDALRIELVRGRGFTDADGPAAAQVAMVNESFARHYFPDGNAIGERVQVAMMNGRPIHPEFETREAEIVGVVGDIREASPDATPLRTVYVPQSQVQPQLASPPIFVLRMHGGSLPSAAVASVFQELDPRLPPARLRPMEAMFGDAIAAQRFNAALVASFGALALALTLTGIYGVLSYTVRQRTREMGIRIALGARAENVVRSVVGRGAALVGIGLVVGLAGALAVTRMLEGLLYQVRPADPVTLGAVAALILLAGATAAWLPARRAARVDPMIALRAE